MSEVQLRVEDARQRDVYRGIARIDQKTMKQLGISAGDVIEIIGKRNTAAIAWPAYSEDQNRDIKNKYGPQKLYKKIMDIFQRDVRSGAVVEALRGNTLQGLGLRDNANAEFGQDI